MTEKLLKQALKILSEWLAKMTEIDPLENLKALYGLKQWPIEEGFNLLLLQDYDNPNTFNDWLIVHREGEAFKIRCTGEAGEWKGKNKKWGWTSAFLPGRYPKLFRAGKFRGLKALRMVKTIKVGDKTNNYEPRSAGGCHIHGRKSKSEKVGSASAGCIVPFDGQAPVDILHQIGTAQGDLTLCVATVSELDTARLPDWKQWARRE